MSFAARLIHTLVHVHTPLDDRPDHRDADGQPTAGTPVRTTVRGLVQPKTGSESPDYRDAGTAFSDHVIFLSPMTLQGSDFFEYGGDRYDVVTVRSFAFGSSPHLEVDAKRVVAELPIGSLVGAGS